MKSNNLKELFHYTSPDGMLGILNSMSLWFTDYYVLNDESEGSYVYNLVDQVLNNSNYCAEFINLVLDEINANFPKSRTFICSFSLNYDSHLMWNCYSKSSGKQGYNIGLKLDALSNSINNYLKDRNISVFHYKVIYDVKKQKVIIKTILDKYYNLYLEKRNVRAILEFIHSDIRMFRFTFKHPTLKDEEEYRIVLNVSINSFKEILKAKDSIINFRALNNGVIASYIAVPFDTSNTISSITSSPLIKDKAKVSSLNMICDKYELYECELFESSIPLRY